MISFGAGIGAGSAALLDSWGPETAGSTTKGVAGAIGALNAGLAGAGMTGPRSGSGIDHQSGIRQCDFDLRIKFRTLQRNGNGEAREGGVDGLGGFGNASGVETRRRGAVIRHASANCKIDRRRRGLVRFRRLGRRRRR